MGDIFCKVTVCGVRTDGEHASQATLYALLDSGASAGVISMALAEKTHGTVVKKLDYVEGVPRDVMLAKYRAHVLDCGERGLNLIVSDLLVDRAGVGPDGRPVQMILGHDYMRRTRMAFLFSEKSAEIKETHRRILMAQKAVQAAADSIVRQVVSAQLDLALDALRTADSAPCDSLPIWGGWCL